MSDRELPGTIEEMVHFHDKILLRGNGKAALMTRMETQENAMDSVTDRFDKHDEHVRERFTEMSEAIQETKAELKKEAHELSAATNKRIDATQKMFWTIIILLVTTLGTTIAELAKDRSRERGPQTITAY